MKKYNSWEIFKEDAKEIVKNWCTVDSKDVEIEIGEIVSMEELYNLLFDEFKANNIDLGCLGNYDYNDGGLTDYLDFYITTYDEEVYYDLYVTYNLNDLTITILRDDA